MPNNSEKKHIMAHLARRIEKNCASVNFTNAWASTKALVSVKLTGYRWPGCARASQCCRWAGPCRSGTRAFVLRAPGDEPSVYKLYIHVDNAIGRHLYLFVLVYLVVKNGVIPVSIPRNSICACVDTSWTPNSHRCGFKQ